MELDKHRGMNDREISQRSEQKVAWIPGRNKDGGRFSRDNESAWQPERPLQRCTVRELQVC